MDSPWSWEFVPTEPRVVSLQNRLNRFYENFQFQQAPLAWSHDPKNKEGQPLYDPITNHIIAPFGDGFFFVIERQYREIFGPHATRLFYQSSQQQREIAWVAVTQLNAMWHSDERMQNALREAIKTKQLYQSKKTAETIVIL